jgi:hypothetical protein
MDEHLTGVSYGVRAPGVTTVAQGLTIKCQKWLDLSWLLKCEVWEADAQ